MRTRKGRTPVTRRRPSKTVQGLHSSNSNTTRGATPLVTTRTSWDSLPVVLTVNDTASLLRISDNCCYELLQRSDLRTLAVRVGNQWRFSRDRIRSFLEDGAA
jgi:excisionase family DNA binding protein